MERKKHIETGWQIFVECVYPDGLANEEQLQELREAFFAGAYAVFETVTRGLSPGDGVTENDVALMDSVHSELKAHKLSHVN